MSNIKTLLCTIVKNEENYLDEFINHYKELGFTNVILYDNNDIKNVFYDDEFVKIDYSFINKKNCQFDCYTKCYNDYKNEYNWIAFFDADEFLMLNDKYSNINDYLSDTKFDEFDSIKINWKCYGDNDIEECTSYELKNRFIEPLPIDIKLDRIHFKQNEHIKTIIRCKNNVELQWKNPHCPINIFNACDNNGNKIELCSFPFNKINYESAWINHYVTKTITEYIQKIDRGYPDHNKLKIKEIKDLLEEFFIYNKETSYKRQQIDKYLSNKEKNNLTIYVCAHKNFDESIVPKTNHQIIYRDKCNNLVKENFDNCFSEGMQIYEIYQNINLPDYVGICHYRRYFDVEDYSKLIDDFNNYDIIVGSPIQFGHMTIYEQYSNCLMEKDLRICGAIIKKYYPEYLQDFCDVMNGHEMYICNMMIIDRDRFKSYCNWVYDILFKYLKYRKFENDDDVILWCEANKDKIPNINKGEETPNYFKTPKYNARICGHIMERLMNVWIRHNIDKDKIKTYDIKMIK